MGHILVENISFDFISGKIKKPVNSKIYEFLILSYSLLVTPAGFEPISSEPESEILSIELRGHLGCKFNFFLPRSKLFHF